MKTKIERIRLTNDQVKHRSYEDSEGVCEVCGAGHDLIHEVTLPYSVPFESHGELLQSSIHLCTNDLKTMFELPPTRFPKKKKKSKAEVPPKRDPMSPRFYQLKRLLAPTIQILGLRPHDHYSGIMQAGSTPVELFFAVYTDDVRRYTYATSCVKVLGRAYNFVVPVLDTNSEDDILQAIRASSDAITSVLSSVFDHNGLLHLIVSHETTKFIQKVIGLR